MSEVRSAVPVFFLPSTSDPPSAKTTVLYECGRPSHRSGHPSMPLPACAANLVPCGCVFSTGGVWKCDALGAAGLGSGGGSSRLLSTASFSPRFRIHATCQKLERKAAHLLGRIPVCRIFSVSRLSGARLLAGAEGRCTPSFVDCFPLRFLYFSPLSCYFPFTPFTSLYQPTLYFLTFPNPEVMSSVVGQLEIY
jgi:hypothetical protein